MSHGRGERRGRSGRPLAGLAGFALGAATVLLIVWLYGKSEASGGTASAAARPGARGAAPAPCSDASPRAAVRGSSGGGGAAGRAPPPVLTRPPADLAERDLLVPVQGVPRDELQDTFDDARGQGRVHERDRHHGRPRHAGAGRRGGADRQALHQQAGRPDDLPVRSHRDLLLLLRPPGPLRPRPQGGGPGAPRPGDRLRRITGNASPDGPHLHFEITRLHADKKWWQGDAINPYPILREGR